MSKLIWITGLAGSGKTTIGKQVFNSLKKVNSNTVFVDGDNYREIFGQSGYSRTERINVAKNIIKLCQFLVEQDIYVVCCTISLFEEIHQLNKKVFGEKIFQVYVKCDFQELLNRDQKQLYSKAISGEIKNVVGVDIEFDSPSNPNIVLNNTEKELLNLNIKTIINKIIL